MRIRGLMLVSIVLLVGITALVLHLLAMCSSRWKITKREREPAMAPVSYGLWERCEHVRVSLSKQGVPLGERPNVRVCVPNRYMRYSVDNFDACYRVHRQCSVLDQAQLPAGCSCRYVPSTKAMQWLTVLAAIFIVLGLLVLYFRAITTPQNESANLIFSFGPFVFFLLASLSMIVTLILIGAYLRRDTYEDFTFPLTSVPTGSWQKFGFDLHSLRVYAERYKDTFPRDRYLAARKELFDDANQTYHTNIGSAAVTEIIATILLVLITVATFYLGSMLRSDAD